MYTKKDKNINELRKKALKYLAETKLTKYRIAKDTGFSETAVGKWINGDVKNLTSNTSKSLIAYFESVKGDFYHNEVKDNKVTQSGNKGIVVGVQNASQIVANDPGDENTKSESRSPSEDVLMELVRSQQRIIENLSKADLISSQQRTIENLSDTLRSLLEKR